MTILGTFVKQPAEQESYSIDFTDDMVGSDSIVGSTATVDVAGLTVVSSITVGKLIKTTVSGGTNLAKYKVTVTVTTNDGRILQDEFVVKIKDV